MADNLIDQLRAKIDDKHSEAVRALSIIAAYLESEQSSGLSRLVAIYGRAGKTNRELVVDSLGESARTVDEICSVTGLTVKQVRGVIDAPNLRGTFVKRRDEGKTAYSLANSEMAADGSVCAVVSQRSLHAKNANSG